MVGAANGIGRATALAVHLDVTDGASCLLDHGAIPAFDGAAAFARVGLAVPELDA